MVINLELIFSPNLFVFNSFGLCYNEGREKKEPRWQYSRGGPYKR